MRHRGLTGRLRPDPKWKCPDCRQWLADCPCSLMSTWLPTTGQMLEAMYRARLGPTGRLLLRMALPIDVHLWNRVPVEQVFDVREAVAVTGLRRSAVLALLRRLWRDGWLYGTVVHGHGRILKLALTVPESLLLLRLPPKTPETGRQTTPGMMKE